MLEELRGCEYPERLRRLGYTDLETRRKRRDLIQIYKLVNGLEEVDIGMKIGKNMSRSHSHQLVTEILKKTWGEEDF